MHNLISSITATLSWEIVHVQGKYDLEIFSDPWLMKHTIKMPTKGDKIRDIEYLHELAHAVLAERHILLGAAQYNQVLTQEDINALEYPCCVAADWFAEALLMEWAPDETIQEIRETTEYIIKNHDKDFDQLFYRGGFVFAQDVYYLKRRLGNVPPQLRPVVITLLSTDPAEQSITAMQNLINKLASLTCRHQVVLEKKDGIDVWEIKKSKKETKIARRHNKITSQRGSL